MQKCRSAEVQKRKSAETQKRRSAKVQKRRSAEAQKCKSAEVQKRRNAEVQKRRSAKVQKHKSTKMKECQKNRALVAGGGPVDAPLGSRQAPPQEPNQPPALRSLAGSLAICGALLVSDLCTFALLHFRASAFLHFCARAPPALLCFCVSALLRFCASAFLRFCTSAFLRFCASAFLHFCIFAFLHSLMFLLHMNGVFQLCCSLVSKNANWALVAFRGVTSLHFKLFFNLRPGKHDLFHYFFHRIASFLSSTMTMSWSGGGCSVVAAVTVQ